MTTRAEFATLFLNGLTAAGHEAPVTTANIDGLVAQQVAEDCAADYNPMATEEPWEGATDFNPAGVKNYPSLSDGVAASVKTLTNGDYPRTLAAIALGSSAMNIANAWQSEPWGTEPFGPFVDEVQADRPKYYDELIGGSSPEPTPPEPEPVLTLGSNGPAVTEVQTFYNEDCEQHLAVDGWYGVNTEGATKNFQIIMHLVIDGIVGPQTWEAINYVKVLHGH